MLRFLTAGESHGKGLTVILEGLPSGLSLDVGTINAQLAKRQKGYGRGGRMKIETDTAEITAGVRHGKTLGSPLALWVPNTDFRSWKNEMASEAIEGFETKKGCDAPRPGHADLVGGMKYNHRDLRNVLERASARETTVRVAAGAVCQALLGEFGIQLASHVTCIGGVKLTNFKRPAFSEIQKLADASETRCLDATVTEQMKQKIDEAKSKGDTVGGIFELIASGMPPGVGSYVQWDRKLDAQIAMAILSIQAIKGVEIGLGFELGNTFGSQSHDEIHYEAKKFYHATNRAGGIEGGMSNGEEILVRAVMKPIATLYTPLHSVNIDTKEEVKAGVERSDTCAVPAASMIAENVLAFVLARAFLEKFGGDSVSEIHRNHDGYLKQIQSF